MRYLIILATLASLTSVIAAPLDSDKLVSREAQVERTNEGLAINPDIQVRQAGAPGAGQAWTGNSGSAGSNAAGGGAVGNSGSLWGFSGAPLGPHLELRE